MNPDEAKTSVDIVTVVWSVTGGGLVLLISLLGAFKFFVSPVVAPLAEMLRDQGIRLVKAETDLKDVSVRLASASVNDENVTALMANQGRAFEEHMKADVLANKEQTANTKEAILASETRVMASIADIRAAVRAMEERSERDRPARRR